MHCNAGERSFAVRLEDKQNIVGYYYGLLVYANMRSAGFGFTTYGVRIIEVTTETFLKCVNRLLEAAMDRNLGERPVRKVLFVFYASCYVSSSRHQEGDEAAVGEKQRAERRKNIEFYQTESLSCASSFNSYKLLAARVLQNMKYRAILVVEYGGYYNFS